MRPFVLLTVIAASAAATDFKLGNHTFTVPDGFEIEAVAAPPLVDRPINVSFDETGALYVTDSSGSNDKPDVQVKNPTHRVLRLVDKDGDGKFDDKTVFADKLSFPEGAMWLDGSLYISAPPQIWKFTDTDADGIAEKREVWFDGKTLTGCANDLHGPYAGPDGFIYWCKGAFAEQRHTLADGKQLVTKASHVFRARPDGSGLENVMTGGMDNPVDVVFTPGGERLVSGTFFVNPGGGKRDGILHAVWGGVYGKDHAVLDGHPRTGELMPVMTHIGPAAACGLELTRSPAWGAEWLGNVFCCDFNLRKITRHILAPDGATFKTTDSDFVVSDNTDFHPTDIIEDADGTLVIADTGGWYKLCCPTSTLAKADVLGAIYRMKKKDAQRVEDPRGLKLEWAKADAAALAIRLSDPRHEVAARAVAALAKIGEPAIAPIATLISTPRVGANAPPIEARLNAIHALTRISGESARAAVRFAFADKSPLVRIAVAQSASLWRDAGATEALINHLTHADAQLRRISAEALGRIGDKRAVSHLVRAASQIDRTVTVPNVSEPVSRADNVMEHTFAFALFDIGNVEAIRAAMNDAISPGRRISLAALDMLHELKGEMVVPLITDDHTGGLLAWQAERLMNRHPEWGGMLAAWIRKHMEEDGPHTRWAEFLLREYSSNPAIQGIVAELLDGRFKPKRSPQLHIDYDPRLSAIKAMGACDTRELPVIWHVPLMKALQGGEEYVQKLIQEHALPIAAVSRNSKRLPDGFHDLLRKIAADPKVDKSGRIHALSALGSQGAPLDDVMFNHVVRNMNSSDPLQWRLVNADILVHAILTAKQREYLLFPLKLSDAFMLPKFLAVYESGGDESLGLKLLDALRNANSKAALQPDVIRKTVAKFPKSVQIAAQDVIAANSPNSESQRARLETLAAELPKGDIRRGHQIFRSTKSTCTACHAMAYVGGKLGPDLTKIGATRTERDLLEAIIFPNASFVRSYEPVFVKTKSGEQLGILKKDATDEIILATGPETEVRIPRAEVLGVQPAPVSLMPPGMDGILSPGELADLVAFLKSQK